jgi:hypothetical protein
MQAAMAECSLSTFINFAGNWPLAQKEESISTTSVWGVMG